MTYRDTKWLAWVMMSVCLVLVTAIATPQPADSEDQMISIEGKNVKVGGEIGRRINVTVENNLLVMDVDNDFLLPFKERTRDGGYIGLGKTIEAAATFADYTNDERVIALKNH
ncbi:MAG: hypothetical protein ABIH23_34365, partial [bacterium]